MAESGFVYARFFSGEPAPCGYSITPIRTDKETGHGLFELRSGEAALARFWIGHGGACNYKGTAHPLPEGTGYVYGFSECHGGSVAGPPKLPDAELLRALAGCLQELPASSGAESVGKVILCNPAALPPECASAAGLCLVATYSSLRPGLACAPVVRRAAVAENLAILVRTRASLLAAAAARALSASSLRRYLIEGRLGGRRTRIAFNGPKVLAQYYRGVIFGVKSSTVRLLAPWQGGASAPADIEATWLARGVAPPPGCTVLPAWVEATLDTPESIAAFERSLPETAASDLRKMRRSGLVPVMSTQFIDFLLFYHSMYLPMLRSRYCENSLYQEFQELAGLFRDGSMLFMAQGRRFVAGMLFVRNGDTLKMKVLGTAAGSYSHTRDGANAALVFHAIEYACQNGLRAVEFGYSSPFGSDGTLKFKMKWGAKPVTGANPDLLCLRFRDEETKAGFFAALQPLPLETIRPAGARGAAGRLRISPAASRKPGRQKAV
jgi:hypothetical protein